MQTKFSIAVAIVAISFMAGCGVITTPLENLPPDKNTVGDQIQNSQTETNLIQPYNNSTNTTMTEPTQPKEEPTSTKKIETAGVILHTTAGDIEIALNIKDMPITAGNFITLSKKDFYNNTIFHRVIKGFMIQGGDPKGNGTGGPGYKFDDEPFTGEYTRGTIAMANSGPNTNGSQFFIMHADYPLPKNYIIFGHVTKGMDVVDKIATAEVTYSDTGELSKPVEPIKIKTVTVVEK